jgi:hypothetical protein
MRSGRLGEDYPEALRSWVADMIDAAPEDCQDICVEIVTAFGAQAAASSLKMHAPNHQNAKRLWPLSEGRLEKALESDRPSSARLAAVYLLEYVKEAADKSRALAGT